jgi:hypothetical protein
MHRPLTLFAQNHCDTTWRIRPSQPRAKQQKSSSPFEHPVTFKTDNAPSGALSVKRNWSKQHSILGMLANILSTENLLHKIGNAHGYALYCTNSMKY